MVKNVAGFDLTRLLTGSWGTLGVITEATVRLHALPETDRSIVVPLRSDASEIEQLRRLLRRLPFTPYACEVVNAALGKQLAGIDASAAIVRLGGNSQAVNAQRSAFAELGDVNDVAPDVWERLRTAEPAHASTLRFSALPSEISATWNEALVLAQSCAGTLVHATPARGIVRCIVPEAPNSIAAVRRALANGASTTRIGERLPSELWPLCPSSIGDRISGAIKRTFDPGGVLNPGILGEVS